MFSKSVGKFLYQQETDFRLSAKKDDFLAIDVSVKADSSSTKASNRTPAGA
jgi:hypothetical protein